MIQLSSNVVFLDTVINRKKYLAITYQGKQNSIVHYNNISKILL